MTFLSLSHTGYQYGASPAVEDVSFSIERGELVSIVGTNGSGKSTLLKLIARVLPCSGEISFLDTSLADWDHRGYARKIGYLSQEPDLAFSMKALDVVLSGRAPYLGRFEWERQEDLQAAHEALEQCDALHLAHREMDEMSGGERKRIFLARVLAGRPELILLDEPLSALDASHMQKFLTLMQRIAESLSAAVVFVSHDLNWSAAFARRVLVLSEGKLVADGTPEQILTPESVRRYFGFEAILAESADRRRWIVPNMTQS